MKSPGILFGLLGTGGCARGIMPFARDLVGTKYKNAQIVYVESAPHDKQVNGIPVLSEEDFLGQSATQKLFNIAISDSKVRATLAQKFETSGCIPLTLEAPDVLIYDKNEIGGGAILCARTMITSNIKLGRYFHANIYSYVEHDCIIGDYVTFAPRVNCNGNVHIGSHAYIGTGAVIRQGKPGAPLVIGEGAIVGMGAVVTKNVPPHTTVIGNPARIKTAG